MVALRFEFLFVERARLAFEVNEVGDDVGRLAAFDDADVGGGLFVYAKEFHVTDSFGGDLDGRDAVSGATPACDSRP